MENASFMDRLRQLGERAREFWTNMSLNQKVLFAGAALLILVAGGFVVFGMTQTEAYEVLYSNLSLSDASAVTAKLDELGIQYGVENDGTTITVPAAQKYNAAFKLAAENIPAGQGGYELFDQTNFGETQTDKAVKLERAQEGELARTIMTLEKVDSARVDLAIPEETLYSDKEKAPTASISISLKPSQELTRTEIRGIINLVAHSVVGMTPENVGVYDQTGREISADALNEDANNNTVEEQRRLIDQEAKNIQGEVQSMLDTSLGSGNTTVRLKFEIVYDKKKEQTEEYTNDITGPHVRSEQIIKESGTDVTNSTANAPGTDTNIPEYTQANEGTGTSTYDKSDKTVNYELDNQKTQTEVAPGRIDRDTMTIAVQINNKVAQNLGETDIAQIRQLVANAAGLYEDGNDNIRLEDRVTVSFIDFYERPDLNAEAVAAQGFPWMYAAAGAGALVLLLAVIILLTSRRRQPGVEEEEFFEGGFDEVIEEEIRIEDLIERAMTPEEKERQKIRDEIDKLIEESPESAVQVIRTWLLEDQR